MELAWLSPLYDAVGHVLAWIHSALSYVLPADSGWAWGLSIVLLTVAMRILLFPLFVKQMNTQRKMQDLQPQIQKVRERYKHDKQRQQQEQMKLFQESGTNPMMGCLPILLQMPVFFALFQVLRSVAEGHARYGFSQELADSAREALIFGAPVAATFTMPAQALETEFGASPILAKIVIALACAIMGLTTFLTIRQGIKRSATQMPDSPMMQPQKIMMYLAPAFGLFGLAMPVGVLIYWVSNNLWTMAQQHYLYKRNPVGGAKDSAEKDSAAKDSKTSGKAAANGQGPSRGADSVEVETPKIERRQPRKQPRAKRRPK